MFEIYQKSLIFIPDFQTLWLSRMPHKYVINWHTMANQPHSSGQLWKLMIMQIIPRTEVWHTMLSK